MLATALLREDIVSLDSSSERGFFSTGLGFRFVVTVTSVSRHVLTKFASLLVAVHFSHVTNLVGKVC